MKKIDSWFVGVFIGSIPPLIGFLAGWWGTFRFVSERQVILAAIAGVLVGLAVDGFFLKKWMEKAWTSRMELWILLFVFYSICVFGFFMGVPVFNMFLAIPAGFFMARRIAHSEALKIENRLVIRQTQVLTTLVLAAICTASAFFAWRDPSTAANLEGMFQLQFEMTRSMIAGLIVFGGLGLLLINWWLTGKVIDVASKWTSKAQDSEGAKITSA